MFFAYFIIFRLFEFWFLFELFGVFRISELLFFDVYGLLDCLRWFVFLSYLEDFRTFINTGTCLGDVVSR